MLPEGEVLLKIELLIETPFENSSFLGRVWIITFKLDTFVWICLQLILGGDSRNESIINSFALSMNIRAHVILSKRLESSR